MRYDHNFVANARIVAADELAQIIDAATVAPPEHSGLELPRWVWGVMLGGYASFFGGLIAATGGEARAAFAITISVLYTTVFFGAARVLASVDGRRVRAFTKTGGELRTWTGPMGIGAVAGQVLTIPLLLGFFGVAIAVVSAVVF